IGSKFLDHRSTDGTRLTIVFDHSTVVHFDQVAKNSRFRNTYTQSNLIYRASGMFVAEILINIGNDVLHRFCAHSSHRFNSFLSITELIVPLTVLQYPLLREARGELFSGTQVRIILGNMPARSSFRAFKSMISIIP